MANENSNTQPEKRRWKISFFDIIIIVLVIALAGAYVVHKTHSTSDGGAQTAEVTYTVEITDLEKNTEGMIKKGDSLIDKVKKYNIGKVQSVDFYPYEKSTLDENTNQYVNSVVPDRYSAAIVVKTDCVDNGASLTADGGFPIKVGHEVSLVGPGYSGSGYIISIERGDN